MRIYNIVYILFCVIACSCSAGSSKSTTEQSSVPVVANSKVFNSDTAYNYIKQQVDFGPRVPGTVSHRNCAKFIVETLKRHDADTVIEQKTTVTAFNGDKLPINNIMGRYNSQAVKRILLLAHWDTRPWADAERDPAKHDTPIPGANDGGSGVGVLLEIARNMSINAPSVGIDLLFVDAEDYGNTGGDDNSWCLGTQYWVKHMPYSQDKLPRFGVLLDIVGGVNAKFYREYFSEYFASPINDKVWATANASGYGSIFINQARGAVTDDHYHINVAGIPCVDIIECNNQATGSFPPTWHTLSDDMKSIDKNSLKAVGQTVLNLIYNE